MIPKTEIYACCKAIFLLMSLSQVVCDPTKGDLKSQKAVMKLLQQQLFQYFRCTRDPEDVLW
eukprot:UN00826